MSLAIRYDHSIIVLISRGAGLLSAAIIIDKLTGTGAEY
ncbi:MAG: hypothetical protein ACI9WS_002702 [Paraglaciecola psychrophila]